MAPPEEKEGEEPPQPQSKEEGEEEEDPLSELESLLSSFSFSSARSFSLQHSISPSYVSQRQALYLLDHPSELTPSLLVDLFTSIDDKEWVASAALKVANLGVSYDLTKLATELGLLATEEVKKGELKSVIEGGDNAGGEIEEEDEEEMKKKKKELSERVNKLCWSRKLLLEIHDKVKTWDDIWGDSDTSTSEEDELRRSGGSTSKRRKRRAITEEDDDAWGMGADDEDSELDEEDEEDSEEEEDHGKEEEPASASTSTTSTDSHPSLSTFLHQPLLDTALSLSATSSLSSLQTLCFRHSSSLFKYRFDILEAIPDWEDPVNYLNLLPKIDEDKDEEMNWDSQSWRKELDWSEKRLETTSLGERKEEGNKLTGEQVRRYYVEKIERVSSLGLISVSLSLVQHGASLGVSGLDELGEELSLLSKLVYDRPPPPPSTSANPYDQQELTLSFWRSLSPSEIVSLYLSHSTPSTITSDIKRLVLPYLSVLESLLERAGTPDPSLSTTLLYSFILSLSSSPSPSTSSEELKLSSLVSIFTSSLPTLPHSSRLIKSDEDLARLALASIYGTKSTTSNALVSLSTIFECLPAFEDDSPSSLSLLNPSLLPTTITAESLFNVLKPFTPSSLSLALDALDLHLSTAEIFSRYSTPVPLSWFLTSYEDVAQQKRMATQMARTSFTGGGGRGGRGDEGEFESEDEWVGLMDDMLLLGREEEDEEGGQRKAFGLVEKKELLKIFFAGLLSAGKFGLAKSLFRPSSGETPLDSKVEEELVVEASREFYDNAEEGNLHKGNMKLAFDCLSAGPQTPLIKLERDFIEATSRLCSFRIFSHSGHPLTPIEIRLSNDRLSFISRLLASNEDAYRHPDVILELVTKLGFRGDKLAEIRVLGMMCESAGSAGDWEKSAELAERIVEMVEGVRKSHGRVVSSITGVGEDGSNSEDPKKKLILEASELAWRNCFQVGKNEEFKDLDRRMKLLGLAIALCPRDKIPTLLPVWTDLEDKISKRNLIAEGGGGREGWKRSSSAPPTSFVGSTGRNGANHHLPTPPHSATTPYYKLPSPTSAANAVESAAAVTSRTLNRAAAFFPFGGGTSGGGGVGTGSGERSQSPARGVGGSGSGGAASGHEGSKPSIGGIGSGIGSRFTAGVGWLIGADEVLEQRYRDG